MWKRDDDRCGAESPADTLLEPAGTEEALDRHLSDRNHHPWLEDSQLRVQPVCAVGDGGRRRAQVPGVARVPPREAPHQSGDVGEASKFVRALETRMHHPAIELLAGTAGKWPPRLAFGPPGRLADE